MSFLRRRSRRLITLISPVLCLLLIYHFLTFQSDPRTVISRDDVLDYHRQFQCPPLPGIEDILVVLKTGVTEALDKLPVHFQTTLRCVPNYVIFSDFEETIGGVQVHDVLRSVDSSVRETILDFDIYNRLREFGRDGLSSVDLRDEPNSATGKPNNPGWKLDKWKFLPMINESLRYQPDAKWFMFMEADTYVVWPNLLGWLAHLDPTEPHYIGAETQIGDIIFAHGGSGFIISNPAMQRVSDHYADQTQDIHRYTDFHWAGDCVLGQVLHNVGVPLQYAWPMLQNAKLGEIDPFTNNFYRKPWCFPTVTYHHMTPADIQLMWRFEQHRYQQTGDKILLHSDLFKELIRHEITTPRVDWDNLSEEGQDEPVTSFKGCQARCESDPACQQYSFKSGKCSTSKTPKLGISSVGVQSGWMTDRIDEATKRMRECREVDWGQEAYFT